MKAILAAVLAITFAAAPLMAVQVEGNKWVFSDDELAQCEESGGCAPVTKAAVVGLMKKAYEAGLAAGVSQCRATI